MVNLAFSLRAGKPSPAFGPAMEDQQVRALIRSKMLDGRLPTIALTHVIGEPAGQGAFCVACDENILKGHTSMGGQRGTLIVGPFHARCFHLWDSERRDGGSGVFRLPGTNGGT